MKHGPKILFLSVENWLMAERLPLLLHEAGCVIAAISRKGTSLDMVPWRLHNFWRDDGNVLGTINSTIDAFNPDLLILVDESAVQLLRFILQKNPDDFAARHGTLLQKSFGDMSSFDRRGRRSALGELATLVKVPEFVSGEDPAQLLAFGRAMAWNCMFKTEGSAAGTGVFRSEDVRGYTHHAQTLANGHHPFVVQRFIPGRHAMRTVASLQGRVLCGLSLERIEGNHAYGYSTVVTALNHAGMAAACSQVAAAWNISGIFACDFVVDAENVAWLIEVNPRPTTTLHLGRLAGVDFAQAVTDIAAGNNQTQTDIADNQRPLALFPKEWFRSSDSAWLATADNDIPWAYPDLIAHYATRLQRKKAG